MVDDSDTVPAIGVGTVKLKIIINNKPMDLIIQNVLHVPELDSSLLSAAIIIDKGFEIRMNKDIAAQIYHDNTVVATTTREGNLFRLNMIRDTSSTHLAKVSPTVNDLIL